MSTLAIDHVAKSYGAAPVLSDLSLDIEQGEFVVLLGPSGCGKSTLLNIVAGLDRADQGRILIGGKDVTRAEPRARDIAMVFQSYALYPTMTARKNMAFGLKMRGVARAEIDRLVGEAARLLRIEDLLDRRPAQLSGGQRQRVAIGRAIVRKPAVFLFDEPLSNLDAKLRAETRLELKELHRRLGATILYVTHDQTEAMTLATRIAVMNRGAIEQIGPPQEIYDRPATSFVAGFTGAPAMNLVPGILHEAGGKLWFRPDGAGDELLLPAGLPLRAGRRVLFGLRPEWIGRAGPDRGDETYVLTLAPLLVEPTGADTNVVFRLGEARIVARFAPGAVGPGPVQVALDPGRASWFDAETGRRL
jgi:multiple sugar transport system ATP-binding protein